MSKKQVSIAPAKVANIPADFSLEIPAFTNTQSTAIDGSTTRAIGYGITDGTGKDGKTRTWLVTMLAIKPNGKGKYATLQNTVKHLSMGAAKGYNPFTKDFKSELEALRACARCADTFDGYVLKDEVEKINAAKSAGRWEVTKKGKDDKKKITPHDFGVTLAEKITAKYAGDEKWECFNSVYSTIIGYNDNLGIVKELISVLRKSTAVDFEVVEKIITLAIDDIRAAEIATLRK